MRRVQVTLRVNLAMEVRFTAESANPVIRPGGLRRFDSSQPGFFLRPEPADCFYDSSTISVS